MLRPSGFFRWTGRLGVAALAATVPPPALHGALASAAGTVFEAVALVLVTALVPRSLARRLALLAGCGCGSPFGAISVPATVLCWINFGPLVALPRFIAGLAVAALGRRRSGTPPLGPDPLAEMETIAVSAFALGLGLALMQGSRLPALPQPLGALIGFGAGVIAGAFAPCTTAAIAAAAMLRARSGALSAGLLLCAGIVAPPRRSAGASVPARDGRAALALLGAVCVAVALRGGGGFVNPRFLPLVVAGALLCCAAIRSRAATTRARHPFSLALTLGCALLLGSPVPRYDAVPAELESAFVGEHLTFEGVVERDRAGLRLVRYLITCCRADAAPVAVALLHPFAAPNGAWARASGTLVRHGAQLALDASTERRSAPPSDPFLYR